MNNAKIKIKQFVNDHPVESIIIATMAVNAVVKLVNASNDRKNARSWAIEVARRDRMTR